MRIWGRPQEELDDVDVDPPPLQLREATLVAPAPVLRELSEFLAHAADLQDRHGEAFGHEHFDLWRRHKGLPALDADVIVSTLAVPMAVPGNG
jgi:hypothetical protein